MIAPLRRKGRRDDDRSLRPSLGAIGDLVTRMPAQQTVQLQKRETIRCRRQHIDQLGETRSRLARRQFATAGVDRARFPGARRRRLAPSHRKRTAMASELRRGVERAGQIIGQQTRAIRRRPALLSAASPARSNTFNPFAAAAAGRLPRARSGRRRSSPTRNRPLARCDARSRPRWSRDSRWAC